MKRLWTILTFVLLFSIVLSACAAPVAAPGGEAAAPSGPRDFITWYQYDEKNEDPASDERVGNQYLRDTIPQFNQAFAGKWNWVNQPKAWDRMNAELVAAVQAGGDVPDLYDMGSSGLTLLYQNGALQDLREWAQAQSWYADMDPNALEACTGPDGGLYCIPVAERPHLVYVWSDRFPEGFPTTPEEYLAAGERLKADGLYAMTFFGSTDFDGNGATRAVFMTFASFGGGYDDGEGNMRLNTPENVAAVEFLRTMVQSGYVPEIAFAGGFQEEEAFKDASAGAFPTGLFGYRYVNPLTAPNGTAYSKGNEEDMLDAIAAGDVILRPFVAPEGKMPGCNNEVTGFGIPVGAKNPEAAHDYINWIMTPEQNADWVLRPGAGFPALLTTRSSEQFQTPFYQQAGEAIAASACRPWHGSLERRPEALRLIMSAVYRLIKEDPTADIATVLQAAQDEYNAGS